LLLGTFEFVLWDYLEEAGSSWRSCYFLGVWNVY